MTYSIDQWEPKRGWKKTNLIVKAMSMHLAEVKASRILNTITAWLIAWKV